MSIESLKSFFDLGAVALLFITFLFGAGALITGNRINKKQAEQLLQFYSDLTKAKIDLAKAQKDATDAQSGNKQLGIDLANAQSETERLKSENLKLAGRIAVTGHRNAQIFAVQGDLARDLGLFAGQKFEMGLCPELNRDMEVWEFESALAYTLSGMAKWARLPDVVNGSCSAGVFIFVRSAAPESTKKAARRLANLLDAALGKRLIGNKEAGQVGMAEIPTPKPGTWSPQPSESDAVMIGVGWHP